VRQIPLVLRDLVFQDRVTAERVPSQLRQHAVILVPVGKVMRHHQIRRHARAQLLEHILDVHGAMREVAAAKIAYIDRNIRTTQQSCCCSPRLALALAGAGKYHPDEPQLRMALVQLNEHAAASDLDVVAMRAQTENRGISRQVGLESQHHRGAVSTLPVMLITLLFRGPCAGPSRR
jgi:hypothetical protein